MEGLVFPVLGLLFFASAYMTKRRFGLLGLALATGSLLAGIWVYDAGLVAGLFNVSSGPLSSAVISSIIVLLPAGLLMFHGYTYKSTIGRIIGAGLFALLAVTFLIEPIGHVVSVHGFGSNVYAWFVSYRTIIIGVGLILAIVDIFLTKPVQQSDKRHKH